MIIKKYTGKTEAEATEAAKKELGSGLVIMNVREVKKKGIFCISVSEADRDHCCTGGGKTSETAIWKYYAHDGCTGGEQKSVCQKQYREYRKKAGQSADTVGESVKQQTGDRGGDRNPPGNSQ